MAFDDDVPLWLENAGAVYNAREYRRLIRSLVRYPGIVSQANYEVTESAAPGMHFQVAGGSAYIEATTGTDQGFYFARSSAAITGVALDAADPTNGRIDLVVIQVRDSEHDAGGDDDVAISVVTGTPSGSPAVPATPDNCLVLARIAVAAGATSITDANITDLRTFTPREREGTQAIDWTATDTDGDLDSFNVNAPDNYPVLVSFDVAMMLNPLDGIGYDVTIELRSASGGGGSELGAWSYRQEISEDTTRRTCVIHGEEYAIAAGDSHTFYLYVHYDNGTPVGGFSRHGLANSQVVYRIRPDLDG